MAPFQDRVQWWSGISPNGHFVDFYIRIYEGQGKK